MIGLPWEDDSDLEGISRLVGQIQKETRVGKAGPMISVSISNFTPKPHTPFEEQPLLAEEGLRERGRRVAGQLSTIGGIEARLDPPKWTIVQGLLARGGPESWLLVQALMETGGNHGAALKKIGYSPDHPIHGPMPGYKPWRVINSQVGVPYLAIQAEMAKAGNTSPPCPPGGGCGRCRACQEVIA
jgi:hypothetical protein